MKSAILPAIVCPVLVSCLLVSCGKQEAPPPSPSPQASAEIPAAAAKPESPAAEPATPPPPVTMREPSEPVATAAAPERDYTGTVAGQPIIMGLSFQGESGGDAAVTGWYYLEARGAGAKVNVSGTLHGGELMLDESDGNSFHLTADPANDKNFSGMWKGGGRVVPAKITRR